MTTYLEEDTTTAIHPVRYTAASKTRALLREGSFKRSTKITSSKSKQLDTDPIDIDVVVAVRKRTRLFQTQSQPRSQVRVASQGSISVEQPGIALTIKTLNELMARVMVSSQPEEVKPESFGFRELARDLVRLRPIHIQSVLERESQWQKFIIDRLTSFGSLQEGWDSYSAPAPSQAAIRTARTFLLYCRLYKQVPSRVAPSVVGGVGITFRSDKRKVYVEFYNNGTAYALFADSSRTENNIYTQRVRPTSADYQALIKDIGDFLNDRPARGDAT